MSRIPESEWRWGGFAEHFCASHDCSFHMATRIGDYMISTVGDYRPRHKWVGEVRPEPAEIGLGRLYETFVFKGLKPCGCGCKAMVVAKFSEVDSLAANDPGTATENHMAMCNKYAEASK